MRKQKLIELHTPYEARGKLADHKTAVIRVRLLQEWGGKAHYYMDGFPFPVPPVLRHLDGRSVRSVALAVAVALGVGAWAVWRALGTE